MTRVVPFCTRQDLAEIDLDLLRVLVLRPPKALAESDHVGVDDNALRFVPEHAEDDVCRLSPDAGELHELIESLRHLAVVAFHERAAGPATDRAFIRKKPSVATYGSTSIGSTAASARASGKLRPRRMASPPFRADVRRLCAQYDRDNELEG